MRRVDPFPLVRSGLLLGLGVLVAKLLLTGQMRYYIVPSLDPLMALTGVLLAAMGAIELRRALHGDNAQGGSHARLDLGLSFGLVAVPLFLGLAYTPRSLGAAALGGTTASRLVLAFDSSLTDPRTASAPLPRRPIADVADLLSYLRQAGESGVGQHVHARGLVARSADLRPDEFVLVRYAIVHCVADAQPLGFLVVAAGDGGWTADQWVEIDGTLGSEQRGSDRLVSIEAAQIVATEEPNDPYVSGI